METGYRRSADRIAASRNFPCDYHRYWKIQCLETSDYPGIASYKRNLRHSSAWDSNHKTVAVIGNGASGLQVLPHAQKMVKRLDHDARSNTWIAVSLAEEGSGRRPELNCFSKEQLKSFEDPEIYLRFRKELEGNFKNFCNVFKATERSGIWRKISHI